MKDRFSLVAGFAAGALAMYYLDPRAGRRRRALARDKVVAVGHEAAWLADAKRKRAIDHLKGWLVTRRFDRHTRKQPESDQQLHERIRSRLGRVVSHPRLSAWRRQTTIAPSKPATLINPMPYSRINQPRD